MGARIEDFEKALNTVINDLKAPKGQYNSFGKYNYRNAEDIIDAVKPLLFENNLRMKITDTVELIGDRYYVKATVVVSGYGDTDETSAYAREAEEQKGMNDAQITGSTSSYARKYALNGMFDIDDTKDADTNEFKEQTDSAPKEIRNRQEESKAGAEPFGEKPKSILDQARLDIGEELKRQGYNRPDTMLGFIHDVLGKDKIETIDEATMVAEALDTNALEEN